MNIEAYGVERWSGAFCACAQSKGPTDLTHQAVLIPNCHSKLRQSGIATGRA
jgi:hypothetical protein